MSLRDAKDLGVQEVALAVPKPQVVMVRRAVPGESVNGMFISPAGPDVFVVTDPYSLNTTLWLEEEVDAAYDLLPSGPVESDVPLELAPVVSGTEPDPTPWEG